MGMVTERETAQTATQFLRQRLKGAIHLAYLAGRNLGISVLFIGVGLLRADVQTGTTNSDGAQATANIDWSELIASMDKMHMAMGAVKPSGDSDVDFVRLMLPHHQAAIDMAKTQLLYGKDPQMRRLAQEIITDQQLEIELMLRWLKQRESTQPKENQTPAADTGKESPK
jgi:hypothetical protein